MRLPKPYYQISEEIEQRMPNLSESQKEGLTMWAIGTILAGSGCQSAVAANLAEREGEIASIRQRLREWLYDGEDRARPCATRLNVEECFEPLLRWVSVQVEVERSGAGSRPHAQRRRTGRYRGERRLSRRRRACRLAHPKSQPQGAVDGAGG